MNRVVSMCAVAFLAASVSPVFGQAEPAKPEAPTPAARAKFVPPLKGLATVDVLPGESRRVGKEIVTTFKIKNTSNAPIALLRLDEYWYDKAGKLVSTDTQRHKQPFMPGEIIEMTTRAPDLPGAERASRTFAHANGNVKANAVKKME
jgi:hypothetical protein